jgi:hypothetical protein
MTRWMLLLLGLMCCGCGDSAKDSGDTSDPAGTDVSVDESHDLDADADADGGSDLDVDGDAVDGSTADEDGVADDSVDVGSEDADGAMLDDGLADGSSLDESPTDEGDGSSLDESPTDEGDGSLLDDGTDADADADADESIPVLPLHRECASDADCEEGYFCGIECWTGECGVDGTIPMATLGAYCQPCIECHAPTDAVTGSCDTCGGPAYDMDVDAGPGPVDDGWDDDWGADGDIDESGSSDEDASSDSDGSLDAEPPTVIPPSSRWRVVNVDAVEDHWNVSEMVFYADSACTVSMSEMVTGVIVSSTEVCSDPAEVLNDGACNFEGHCEDGNWANQSALSGAGEIWAGYVLSTASTIGCISICQGAESIHRLSQLVIEKSDDEGLSWDPVQTVTTESTDPFAPTVFILD